MKLKTNELKDAALDWAVRHALNGRPPIDYVPNRDNFSTCWNKAGPILEREDLNVTRYTHSEVTESGQEVYRKDGWTAFTTSSAYWMAPTRCYGPTPLIAAMRCYCASKLGEFVEVPDELL